MWLSSQQPTGSQPLQVQYLYELTMVREGCDSSQNVPIWFVGDSTFEKRGKRCLFGMYDELSTFLTHTMAKVLLFHMSWPFLQLYNGSS